MTTAARHTTRRFPSWRRWPGRTAPPSRSDRRATRGAPWLPMPAATPRASGPETRDPSPARPWRWPVTPCPRRRCTTPAIHQSGPRQLHHGLARRSRTTWCAGQCAWLPGWGHRRVMRRRSVGRAPNSVAPRRCRGWSPTSRHACASRRRRADHRRPPDVRRSAQRSRRPIPARVASIAAASRRCSSARSDLS